MSAMTLEQERTAKDEILRRYRLLIGESGYSPQELENLMRAGERCLEQHWPGQFYRESFLMPTGERHLDALVGGRMKAALEGRY